MRFEACDKAGADASRNKLSDAATILVDTFLVVIKDVLHDDRVLLHAHDLGNGCHFTRATRQAVDLHNQVDRAGNLCSHRTQWHIKAAHHDHRLETSDRVTRRVRMACGQRTIVTGVHRLEHIERFSTTTFADDDPVGTHTQAVSHEVGRRNSAFAFDVCRACFQADHVVLL